MKKILGLGTLALAGVLAFTGCGKSDGMTEEEAIQYAKDQGYTKVEAPAALPAPTDKTKTYTVGSGQNEQTLSCDTDDTSGLYAYGCSSITATNLKDYLGREDVLYYDVKDKGDYETKHLKGFINVEFFNYIYPNGGGNEDSQTLFYKGADGRFAPKYAYSVSMLESIFPKDKTLFLMCKSGGRVTTLMKLLDQYGWDMSKVYNVGGTGSYTTQAGYDIVQFNRATDVYTIYTGSATAKSQTSKTEDDLSVNVKVLYHAGENKIGGVYIAGGTVTTSVYAERWAEEVNGLLTRFNGMSLDDVRATVVEGTLDEDIDVVANATVSTTMVYRAVIDALESAVAE